jgi:integrase/recombinase XerD
MLTNYFRKPTQAALIRRSSAAPYLDGFVAAMIDAGYHPPTIQCHLRAAAHVSHWLQRRGRTLADLDEGRVSEFKRHLPVCKCAGYDYVWERHGRGALLFLRHLRKIAVLATPALRTTPHAPLFVGFCHWMKQHRGARDATLSAYGRIILDALQTLGEDARRFDAAGLRAFVLDRANQHGRSKAKLVVTTLRTFVRYLIAQGLCPVGLDAAVPTIAGWRLAALPRYLPGSDVGRVLAACNPATMSGARDRAILLLLSRLGLRAGDVCHLRVGDIDWTQATVQVSGTAQSATGSSGRSSNIEPQGVHERPDFWIDRPRAIDRDGAGSTKCDVAIHRTRARSFAYSGDGGGRGPGSHAARLEIAQCSQRSCCGSRMAHDDRAT